MSTDEPTPDPAAPEWPEPRPDPEEEPGESEHGVLPSRERIANMDRADLISLRDQVADWIGPKVEAFRAAAAERLADE